ncbi:MAG: phage tail tape measure protein, partial [Bacteroidota bacterium]|nr:phage tail tape measure protein [Bacteroidota bacterium]
MARQSLLSVVLGLKADKFERGLTSAQRKLKATSTSLSQVGRGLSIGLTAPLAAIGASSFKVAADFELAMKKVKAVSGATGSEFAKLEKNALDLGKSTVFSASSVSELQLEMAKLGLSADEIVKATDSTLALAQAFGNDLGPTAETVVKTINQFGLDAEDAGKVADVMATAFGSSALDLEKFGGAMGNVAPVAKEFGFSLEETTALLGVLANNGIEGTDAGTKLKMAFSQLAAEGVNVKETFTGIINGSVSYADAINVLGKRAAILSPIFGKNTDDLASLGVELKTSEGRAKSMAKEMDDSAKGGIAAMRSAIEGAQIQIGNALAPVVLDIIQKITDMAQAFGNMSKETQKSIVKAAAFLAAIGPIASIGGVVTRVVLNLSKAFTLVAAKGFTASMRFKRMAVVVRTLTRVVRANPLGLLVTAITTVTALAIPFISNM